MNKEQAKQQIQKLVDKYQRVLETEKIKSYNEAQTRNEFIEPLFESLGWDMRNLITDNEVTTEESVSGGRVDLAFRFNNIPVLFLEAKAMKVNLDELKWAEQAINYSWNKSVTWAVLTDFESIKIFNAEVPLKSIRENLFIELSCLNFIERFDQLWLLSKEGFEQKLLDKEGEKWGKLTKRKQVGEKLFEDLMSWRLLLTNNFKKENHLSAEELDEGVQRILDRLIFIRTAEDRKIEPNILLGISRNSKPHLYQQLTTIFRDFDNGFNSKLFAPHYCEEWQINDEAIAEVLKGLYETKDGYRYDFSVISADVLGGIYEQYLGLVLEKSKKKSEATKEDKKRKSQGIYYTPKYIVEYIVKETLGEILAKTKLKDLKNIKILDPACGSGSFLTAAYDTILNTLEKQTSQTSLFTKFDILKENIFGVDLDVQAVEIAQLNLLLKVLFQKTKLPTLQHNIRSGNSLISGNAEKLEKYFGTNFREQRAFNFEDEFKDVFHQGGFDVIIGNPPYGAEIPKIQQEFFNKAYNIGSTDTAILFIKKAFDLLEGDGKLGFIVPKAFCFASNWKKVREYIENYIETIVDCGKVWHEVKLEQVIFIAQKGKKRNFYNSAKIIDNQIKIIGRVDKKDAKEFGFFLNGVSEQEIEIAKKIKKKAIMLNDIATNQRGAILQKFISDVGDKEVIGGAQVQRFGVNGIKGKIDSKKIDNNQASIKNNSILVQRIVAHIENPIDHIKITACVPENKNYIIVDTINQITLNDDIDQYVIWYLLNSKLISWYAYRFIFGKAIRTMQFDNPTTARLPIPKNIKDNQLTLAKPIKELFKLSKELQTTSDNTDKHNSLKRDIEKLDHEIDEIIYKLYGLTNEEIKTIENTKK